jgi:aquaporin Z
VLPYVLAQCAGAVLASLALRALFPAHARLGATLPADTALQAWVVEFILTLILMVVILSVSTGARERGVTAGVAVGSAIALAALFAGPVSGASMNPARSLAPAVVALRPEHLWVYLTAPVLGALAGVLVCRTIHGPGGCCHPADEAMSSGVPS